MDAKPRLLLDRHLDTTDFPEARKKWDGQGLTYAAIPTELERMGFDQEHQLFTVRVELTLVLMADDGLNLSRFKHDQRWGVPEPLVATHQWVSPWSRQIAKRYQAQIDQLLPSTPFALHPIPMSAGLPRQIEHMILVKYATTFFR